MLQKLLITIMFIAIPSYGFSEQKVEFNGYELHYIVLNTTEISPAVARTYSITRSGKRAFINLAVLKQTDSGYGEPVAANIEAMQRTLVGQRLDIELEEIREGDAIYYIGTFPIINREILSFDINLSIANGPSFNFDFSEQVWQE